MPDDFLCDPVDSKRYAVDPSDSAFNVMTTQFPPKHAYIYRGSSSCSAPVGICRQASSPAAFQEANRNGEGAFQNPNSFCKVQQLHKEFIWLTGADVLKDKLNNAALTH